MMKKIIIGAFLFSSFGIFNIEGIYDIATNQKSVSNYKEMQNIIKSLEDGKISNLEKHAYIRDGYIKKYNKLKKIKISYFDRYQYIVGKHRLKHFLCKDKRVKYTPTTYAIIDLQLLEKIMLIDKAAKGKFFITSGHRTPTYNSKLKGAVKNSRHLKGRAVDLIPVDISLKELGRIIKKVEKKRPDLKGYMHIYKKHVHTDIS